MLRLLLLVILPVRVLLGRPHVAFPDLFSGQAEELCFRERSPIKD